MPGLAYLDAVVWAVGHGSAVSVRLPNGAVLVLDCGPPSDACSSPALATLRLWGWIDVLSISHPDMDHMGDILNAAAARPSLLVAPDVPAGQVLEGKDNTSFTCNTPNFLIDSNKHCLFSLSSILVPCISATTSPLFFGTAIIIEFSQSMTKMCWHFMTASARLTSPSFAQVGEG